MTDDNAELITELQRLFESQPNTSADSGVTFLELFESMGGRNQGKLRLRLKSLVQSGVIEAIPTTRPNIVNRNSYSVVYRPITQDGEGV